MYKRRDVALAELVANAWDAGAKKVSLILPEEAYDKSTSRIEIMDDGSGMSTSEVQDQYLVIGRNRRESDAPNRLRPVMGKKGIGKLAGFGMASVMDITSWKDDESTSFSMNLANLKAGDGSTSEAVIKGLIEKKPEWAKSASGTRILLSELKHSTKMDIEKLKEALARRFSNRIRGAMTISVNGEPVGDPDLELDVRFPAEGHLEEALPNGDVVRFYYAFTKQTIKSAELRGFTIYVRGKTAQAPPFFFGVEGTASGQHATRYVTGAIEADFLDAGADDASDVISTDRQEIDWDSTVAFELKTWGEKLARKALIECSARKGQILQEAICEDPDIKRRLLALDEPSAVQVRKFLSILGQAEPNQERAMELADSLVRAYEYRHFHDVISDLEAASDTPESLERVLLQLRQWKVLESRAVLEIVKGRIGVIDRCHKLIVNNAPETKSSLSEDNMHDLIAGYPWLLHPEWQVLSEEKTISKQLEEWDVKEVPKEARNFRYDFLALTDEQRLVIVELKRAGHAMTYAELSRFDTYRELLQKGTTKQLHLVLVSGGAFDASPAALRQWEDRTDATLTTWAELYDRANRYYRHYQAVLEGDLNDPSFSRKETEVTLTRHILAGGSVHRPSATRAIGLGPQDNRSSVSDSSSMTSELSLETRTSSPPSPVLIPSASTSPSTDSPPSPSNEPAPESSDLE